MMGSVAGRVVLGVDGCPGGWLGALVPAGRSAASVEWRRFDRAAAILAVGADATAIDIPIGLPESGPRGCDQKARRVLGRSAAASVFPAPVRAVLGADSYEQAGALSRAVAGVGISRQSWHLVERIRDVDAVLEPDRQRHVVEAHPELSFRELDPRVTDGKRGARGLGQRLRALAGWLDAAAALATVPAGVRPDDAVDALAAAWSARRWLVGQARVLPCLDPPRDAHNLRMEIVV